MGHKLINTADSSISHHDNMNTGPQPARQKSKKKGTLGKFISVANTLLPYMRKHWRCFALGGIAAIIVVASRLALPWPLRMVADQWLAANPELNNLSTASTTLAQNPALAMGLVFFAIVMALGLADMLERYYFARFATRTVRDFRADTYACAVIIYAQNPSKRKGDLIARLIGDTARIKTGLQGFLVHVATSGLLFIGLTIILYTIDAYLGLVFALTVLATLIVTLWGSTKLFNKTLKHRKKEGQLANRIQKDIRKGSTHKKFNKTNKSSGRHEASLARTQGIITWITHGIYGLSVLIALVIGFNSVDAGRIQIGDLLIFMMYMLMLRGPLVRLARQGSRTGKIAGATHRLVQIHNSARATVTTNERL